MSEDFKTHASVLAGAVASLLDPSIGIIVHIDGHGYFVSVAYDEEEEDYGVMVNEDPMFLQIPNLQQVSMDGDNDDLIEELTSSKETFTVQ